MKIITKLIDKIFPASSPPEIVIKGGENVGYGWFEARNKLAELTGSSVGSVLPKITVDQAFKRYNSWVYHCVNLIQRKLVQTDYHLYKDKGQPNDEEYDRILDHPLLKLLKRPNKFLSGRQFRQITQTHLDLTGMAFWLILFNGFKTPGELHIMSPNWLTNIVRGTTPDNLIEKFCFSPPNQTNLMREYPYSQVLYFHYPDPSDPLMPLSPLQPLAHILDIDLLLQVYEKDFFTNNARPDGILRTQGDIDESEAVRLQESWGARHRGAGKQHKIAVLTGGIEYQPLGMSAKDFEFPSLSEYIKNQILAAYGVPEAELGLFQSFNKASSVSSESKLVKGCIEPRLRLWEDVINSQLLPLYSSSDDLEFRFDSALPKDDEWQLTETQGYLSTGMTTINAERKKQGLKPFPSPLCDVPYGMDGSPIRGVNTEADKLWDEKIKASMGQAPGDPNAPSDPNSPQPEMGDQSQNPLAQGIMGAQGGRPEVNPLATLYTSAVRNTNPTLATLLNAARGDRGGLSELLKNRPDEVDFGSMLDRSRKDQAFSNLLSSIVKGFIEEKLEGEDKIIFPIYDELIGKIISLENIHIDSMSDFYITKGNDFVNVVDKMIKGYTQKGEPVYDWNSFRNEIITRSQQQVYSAITNGFTSGLQLVEKILHQNITPSKTPEDYAQQNAGKLLNKSADLQVATTKKAITDIISESIKDGDGVDETAEKIQKQFNTFSGYRAMMIARTELSAAMNEGLNVSYQVANQDSGKLVVKEALIWTSLDERVCKECNGEHGKIAISYVKNKEYISLPLHPLCRCVYTPR